MSTIFSSHLPQSLIELSQAKAEMSEKAGRFGDALTSAMEEVDTLQSEADQQVTNLLQGKGQDVHGALLAVEKADISFQLVMQVRNKIVGAYQEIARMQF